VHVQILIGPEPSAEVNVRLGLGQLPIQVHAPPVLWGGYRVVGLIGAAGEPGVLPNDDRAVIGVVTFGVEVPELDGPGERDVVVGVVQDRAALVITDG
jgi:hypothetical protein